MTASFPNLPRISSRALSRAASFLAVGSFAVSDIPSRSKRQSCMGSVEEMSFEVRTPRSRMGDLSQSSSKRRHAVL